MRGIALSNRRLGALGRQLFVLLCVLVALPVWAARNAVVTVEQAIIWADAQRSAPIGYARRGKVIRVGERELERGSVVSLMVSGRIGYVSVSDIAYDDDRKKAVEPEETKASRFHLAAKQRYRDELSAGYRLFRSVELEDSERGRPEKTWNFQGAFLKGEVRTKNERLNVAVAFDYLFAESQNEAFRMLTVGLGASWALINHREFKVRFEAMGLLVPWAQYEAQPLFTLNGRGLGARGQISAVSFLNETWGIEGQAGLEAIKVYGIARPSPFPSFEPFFIGTRFSLGAVARF